jgi:hypothetical protein
LTRKRRPTQTDGHFRQTVDFDTYMKTIFSLKARPVSFLVIALTALVAAPSVFAVTISHTIQVTENSSSDLSVTYDGSAAGITVMNTGTDSWTIDFPSQISFFSTTLLWDEPELNGLVNIFADSIVDHQAFALSDRSNPGGTAFPDDAPQAVGTDTSDNGSIFVKFHDLGDASAGSGVPDTGFTVGLLFLSLVALFGISRLRSIRLA